MTRPGTSRLGVALAVLGGLGVVTACVPGAIASWLAWKGDGRHVDATPAELADPGRIDAGDVVWLRGMRDRDNPVTLTDGRVLYPAQDDPRVMVECGPDACAGPLVGRVEDLTVAGRHVRVVRVGQHGDAAREGARLAALVAVTLLALAIAGGATGAWLIARARRRS